MLNPTSLLTAITLGCNSGSDTGEISGEETGATDIRTYDCPEAPSGAEIIDGHVIDAYWLHSPAAEPEGCPEDYNDWPSVMDNLILLILPFDAENVSRTMSDEDEAQLLAQGGDWYMLVGSVRHQGTDEPLAGQYLLEGLAGQCEWGRNRASVFRIYTPRYSTGNWTTSWYGVAELAEEQVYNPELQGAWTCIAEASKSHVSGVAYVHRLESPTYETPAMHAYIRFRIDVPLFEQVYQYGMSEQDVWGAGGTAE